MAESDLTAARLRQVLSYNPETGRFIWIAPSSGTKTGAVAGSLHPKGYRFIQIDGRKYQEHRLAWLFCHGSFPTLYIDHINGIRDDNRVENLREATVALNNQNIERPQVNNSLGFRGVYKQGNSYCALIRLNRKGIHLGSFPTAELAHQAYIRKKLEIHEFYEPRGGAEPILSSKTVRTGTVEVFAASEARYGQGSPPK